MSRRSTGANDGPARDPELVEEVLAGVEVLLTGHALADSHRIVQARERLYLACHALRLSWAKAPLGEWPKTEK